MFGYGCPSVNRSRFLWEKNGCFCLARSFGYFRNTHDVSHIIPFTCSLSQNDMPDSAPSDHHSLSLAYQTYMRHDQPEQSHFEEVCRSFRQYGTFALCHWKNQQRRFEALPESQKALLPKGLQSGTAETKERAAQYKEAVIRNQFCLDCILKHSGVPHSQEKSSDNKIVSDEKISKVSSVLKSLARDWSSEGKTERDMVYEPILQAVQKYIPIKDEMTEQVPRICVPGAGAYKD